MRKAHALRRTRSVSVRVCVAPKSAGGSIPPASFAPSGLACPFGTGPCPYAQSARPEGERAACPFGTQGSGHRRYGTSERRAHAAWANDERSRSWGKPRHMLQVGRAAQRSGSPRPRWLTCEFCSIVSSPIFKFVHRN